MKLHEPIRPSEALAKEDARGILCFFGGVRRSAPQSSIRASKHPRSHPRANARGIHA